MVLKVRNYWEHILTSDIAYSIQDIMQSQILMDCGKFLVILNVMFLLSTGITDASDMAQIKLLLVHETVSTVLGYLN